jgi:hypothetical protein
MLRIGTPNISRAVFPGKTLLKVLQTLAVKPKKKDATALKKGFFT